MTIRHQRPELTATKGTKGPRIGLFGLFGAGGFGREVMPFVNDSLSLYIQSYSFSALKVVFVETKPQAANVNEHSVVSSEEFFRDNCNQKFFNVALGDSKNRHQIAQEFLSKGISPMSIRSSQSLIYANNEIGDGAIICAQSMITSNVKIGKFFHLNIYSYVAHDCVIGDFVTFAPHVKCNGNVHIDDHVQIGTGAVIRPGSAKSPLSIGRGAIIGMGAVVTKDVPPGTTVVGNPARPITRKNSD